MICESYTFGENVTTFDSSLTRIFPDEYVFDHSTTLSVAFSGQSVE